MVSCTTTRRPDRRCRLVPSSGFPYFYRPNFLSRVICFDEQWEDDQMQTTDVTDWRSSLFWQHDSPSQTVCTSTIPADGWRPAIKFFRSDTDPHLFSFPSKVLTQLSSGKKRKLSPPMNANQDGEKTTRPKCTTSSSQGMSVGADSRILYFRFSFWEMKQLGYAKSTARW